MRLKTWVHGHLQCIAFVFDRGWRRHRRQWCIHQLFAGHFQDDGAYHKWRVHLRFAQKGSGVTASRNGGSSYSSEPRGGRVPYQYEWLLGDNNGGKFHHLFTHYMDFMGQEFAARRGD